MLYCLSWLHGAVHIRELPHGPCAMQTDGESETSRVWKSMDVEAVLAACLDSARDRSQHHSVSPRRFDCLFQLGIT